MTPGGRVKSYIGDGVYAEFDGWQVTLTAEDGTRATNTIYLEPDVQEHLLTYLQTIRDQRTGQAAAQRSAKP